MPEQRPPRVFISYSHDSEKHAQRVLRLANDLRSDGIEAIIDQYITSPSEGWPRWMGGHVRDDDFVVMVCTETYYQRVIGEEKPGVGLGVRWEGKLIYNHLYESDLTRFVPVLTDGGKRADIPEALRDSSYYFIDTPSGYEGLLRRLFNRPAAEMPPVGERRALPVLAAQWRERPLGRLHNVPDLPPNFVAHIQQCVVKILTREGTIKGTGFWVLDGYCLTCMHVILDHRNTPTRYVTLEYKGTLLQAQHCENLSNTERDIAVLKVNSGYAQIVPLGKAEMDTLVRAYGYRQGFHDAYTVTAHLRPGQIFSNVGYVYNLETPMPDQSSLAGMSGSPVFDPIRHIVIGIFHGEEVLGPGISYAHPIEAAVHHRVTQTPQDPAFARWSTIMSQRLAEAEKEAIHDIKDIEKRMKDLSLNELLKIDDMKEGFVFYKTPLSIECLEGNFNEKWIEYPDNIQDIFQEEIEKEKTKAASRGVTFDNNLSYSLRRIDVKRDQLLDGNRKNRYILQLYPTDFEHFVFPNLRLEEKIFDPSTNGEIAVRELCGLNRDKIYLSNLDNMPYHFKVGTGTILITQDDYVITTIRSKRQLIVPGRSPNFIVAHLSAAEGMLGKVDLYNSQPNPFATSVRSLHDELGLRPELDVSINELRCLGIFLDTLRAQPFFMFYLKINQVTALEVLTKWYEAKDKHETDFVLGIKWNVANIIKLFHNVPIKDIDYTIDNREIGSFADYSNAFSKKLKLASNHAQIGYRSALIHDFGEEKLREQIVEYNAGLVNK